MSKNIKGVKKLINEHFEEYGVPSCPDSLFQCDYYSQDLDVLVSSILEYLEYYDNEDLEE